MLVDGLPIKPAKELIDAKVRGSLPWSLNTEKGFDIYCMDLQKATSAAKPSIFPTEREHN